MKEPKKTKFDNDQSLANKLIEERIREALLILDEMEIFKDNRHSDKKKGYDQWDFTLKLVSTEKAINLEEFDKKWEEKWGKKSSNADSLPLKPGMYSLECFGYDKNEKARFLDGITRYADVKLAPEFGGEYYTGAIWEITYDKAASAYRLECQGHLPGPRFLNGIPSEGRVNLFLDLENECVETKWQVEAVPKEPSTFRFKCGSVGEGFYYLNGNTHNGNVDLLNVYDKGNSGTRWKIKLVSENPEQ